MKHDRTPEETKALIQEQQDFCDRNGVSMFMPHDAKCYRCNCNILEHYDDEQIKNSLITGCRVCFVSFVD